MILCADREFLGEKVSTVHETSTMTTRVRRTATHAPLFVTRFPVSATYVPVLTQKNRSQELRLHHGQPPPSVVATVVVVLELGLGLGLEDAHTSGTREELTLSIAWPFHFLSG